MFGKNTTRKKLESRYRKLVEDSRRLSTSNRRASDEKMAEAEAVRQQLEVLDTEKRK